MIDTPALRAAVQHFVTALEEPRPELDLAPMERTPERSDHTWRAVNAALVDLLLALADNAPEAVQ